MTKLWQRTMKGEKGQVLAGILILLALGTLLIAPALNYAATSLNAGRIAEENMSGALAADAGVENVLWSLIDSGSLPEEPYPLLETVNEMQVEIDAVNRDTYTLYNGQLVEVDLQRYSNYERVGIESVIEGVGPVYQCTISVSRQNTAQTIRLEEVGLRLPPGYTYQPGSALWFWEVDDNLSQEEPVDTLDWTGEAHMLTWNGLDAQIKDDEPVTQTFNVTGEGEPEGYYAWVVTNESDIGTVGENTGTLYSITATARSGDVPPETTGKVTADVLFINPPPEIHILFWRTSPQ